MTRFVLATRNAHKVLELREILGDRLGPHELVGLDALPGGGGPEPVEDGATFAENALIKARAAAAHGLPAIADDSGISAVALGGQPGIHSARYAQLAAEVEGRVIPRDDGENLRLLLRRLEGATDRRASFWCAAALVDPAAPEVEREHVELAEWPGAVLEQPAGQGGFGYDPVFRPEGSAVSSAELSREEKNRLSHRAQAFARLVEELRRRYG
ncbi:MAG: non-canonical purine NTP pyrophosphatase [Actinomycetales bacterium]|nr:non-canonical purine NTP pyrophosphatase [Actinomycetales bacterium]